jgi:type I restriction enzyme S subunit
MENWSTKKIKEFAYTVSGGTPSTDIKEYWENGTVPWINSGELSQNDFIKSATTFITELALRNSSAKLMPVNTVVIALTGATTGMSALLQIETSGNQSITGILPSKHHDPLFLLYWLQQNIDKIIGFNIGSAQPHINKGIVDNLDIHMPDDVILQENIAKIIRKVHKAIEQTEALIAKYQRLKTGLMQDLLTRGIDLEGNIRSKETHRFMMKNGMEVPVEWDVKSVNQLLNDNIVADIQDGNHGEKHPKSSDFVKEGIPFIMASDISNNEIDFYACKKITEEQYHSLRIGFAQQEDVLLSHKASIGFVAVVPKGISKIMLTPQVTYYRIKNKEKLSYHYLSWFMRGDAFQNQLSNLAKQSTRDYIGILMQRNLKLAYPISNAEQITISTKIESIDDYLKTEKKKLSKLQSLKTGLMQDLLSGKKRVIY